MLQSMTGFGQAQLETEDISLLVEIKSLNNRFLKTSIKLPDALAFVEQEVERILRDNLARGTISYALHMRNTTAKGSCQLNNAAVQQYLCDLERISTLHGGKMAINVDLAGVLLLPGVCQPRPYTEQEHQWLLDTVSQLTHQAVGQLSQMRTEEGNNLIADLRQNCSTIREQLTAIGKLTDAVLDKYHKRIKQRADEMLTAANLQVDESMLMRELALFAERSDINEEMLRLDSHIEQFLAACGSDEHQTGRRLDFLTQEMFREANTIASKAGDAAISQHVVEVKVAIDRIKEQVQNVV